MRVKTVHERAALDYEIAYQFVHAAKGRLNPLQGEKQQALFDELSKVERFIINQQIEIEKAEDEA